MGSMTSQEYSYHVSLIMIPHCAHRATNPPQTIRVVNYEGGKIMKMPPEKEKKILKAISSHLLGFQVQMTFGDLKGSEGLLHLNKLLLLWLQTLWSGWPKEREKKGKPLGYEPSDHLSSWG